MDDSNDAFADSESLRLGLGFLGKTVNVVVDRPLGSRHPTAGFEYLLNYGFILGVPAPDGEDLDAYVIGLHRPAAEVTGLCIAVVHRLYEDDDKLIVAADGVDRADDCLRRLVAFQEAGRPYVLVRSPASWPTTFTHRAWLADGQLLRDADRLAEIPGVLVHGRLDLGGPPDTAWQLAHAWASAELFMVGTGHGGGKDMTTRIMDATNRFALQA